MYEEGYIRAHRGSTDSNARAREQRAKKETVTSLEGEEQARAEGVGTKVFKKPRRQVKTFLRNTEKLSVQDKNMPRHRNR